MARDFESRRFDAGPLLCLMLAVLAVVSLKEATAGPKFSATDQFEKQVRPLLVEHCYQCHSHQAKRLEAGLYLDSRQGLLQGGDSGPAVVPGKPDESLLIEAVRYESYEMPPTGKLPNESIRILTEWIERGAYWPDEPTPVVASEPVAFDWKARRDAHWAWQPVQRVTPPEVENSAWCRNEIDRFILSRLEQAGLQPARPAENAIWLRRVTFDLIGLPPTVEEQAAFLADSSVRAEAHVVDRLLSSPHFGEKWARHWMDLVRYGETYGHEFDYSIPFASRYRDYLIRALNDDVPYDRLLREHIAGDLPEVCPPDPRRPDRNPIIGTGFWFLGEAVHAPTDVRGDLSTRIENQIDVMSRAFLSLSVACARCHDHKFDAISKEDYYALFGILNSSHRNIAALDPGGTVAATVATIDQLRTAARGELQARVATAEIPADLLTKTLHAAMTSEEVPSETVGPWHLAPGRWRPALHDPALEEISHPLHGLVRLGTCADARFTAEQQKLQAEVTRQAHRADVTEDHSIIFETFGRDQRHRWIPSGYAFSPKTDSLRVNWNQQPMQFSAPGAIHSGLRADVLRGAMRSESFSLQHPRLHYRIRGKGVTVRLVIENFFMDQFQALLFQDATRKNIDTDGEWTWITQSGDLKNHLGERAYLEILDTGEGWCEIDEIRFSDDWEPASPASSFVKQLAGNSNITSSSEVVAAAADRIQSAVRQLVQGDADAEDIAILEWLRKHELLSLNEDELPSVVKLRETAKAVRKEDRALGMCEGIGLDEPVHIRGSHANLGENVPRRFLLAIAGENQTPIQSGSGRAELALRLTDAENPFLSRVPVNRIWHHLFGTGIVASVDDFGVMGHAPSHPELLDWLATDFADHGYSLKQTIRRIVLSQAYRMSSRRTNPLAEQQDPENRLLHRQSVRRLPAEAIRDAILATSGRLDEQMYGASVPVHLTAFMQGRGRPSQSGPRDGDRRRSVYLEIRRNFLSPMLLAFDMPSPFSCMGDRAVSNVPAQSLILMNDPFVMDEARHWANRACRGDSDASQRIESLLRLALGHSPGPDNCALAEAFIQQQAQLLETEPNDPRVWADLCHMLFNMKEFVFLR